ncbi:MAG: 8-oxo-dGTP diphosphatase [Bdellovibrionales bacterium]|nr:8-oxo-dGTP diphosphatase [Bdellovibrionales bacterium]
MNAFETGDRKLIPACLVYIFRSDSEGRSEVLMIHRHGRDGDYHSGKWNGLGGKFEPGESPWQAAAREVQEESGLSLTKERYRWLGTLQFPNFKEKKSEDWLCTVMTAHLDSAEGEKIQDGSRVSDEGTLHWVSAARVMDLNLWEGDRKFLPHVLTGRPFHGTFWYQGQKVVADELSLI